MAVRKLEKSKFVIDYYPQGRKGKRIMRVFNGTESEARVYEAELRKQNITYSFKTNPKIIDIIPDYLEWLKIHRAANTYLDIKKSLKFLMPVFGNVQISRITPVLIDKFKKSRGAKPRTINKNLAYLQSIIQYAVKNGYANPLPFKIEKLPYKRPIPQIPHPTEIEKFLSAINGDDSERKKALILFLWQCGLRWSEAASIRWEDIDWKSSAVYLKTTKGSTPRITALTDDIRAILEPIKKESGYVFENPKTGRPWGSLRKLFASAAKRAGVRRIYPHLLRHGFGTYCLASTGNIRLVQSILGHRSIKTTEWYTQIAPQMIREGIAQTAFYTGKLIPSERIVKKRLIKQKR